MKKTVLTITLLVLIISCVEKKTKDENISLEEDKALTYNEGALDAAYTKDFFQKDIIRYNAPLEGYNFNLPFNYRLEYYPIDNTSGSTFLLKWKITDSLIIDSEMEGFKHFTAKNFIEYLPTNDEGNFFIFKSEDSSLTIDKVLNVVDNVSYQDENTVIFEQHQKLRAFYFEYLQETKEYIIYLSDTHFFNKRPEPSKSEKIEQLLSQLRMAKNIFKPINNPDKNWNTYKKQLTILEKGFFDNLNKETIDNLVSDSETMSYSPKTQGNIKYYTAFKESPELTTAWKKLQSVKKNGILTITETDNNSFPFFRESQYKQVYKSDVSMVYKRDTKESYCLVSKSDNYILYKEFSELYKMSKDHYKNEIEFYRELFENYK
ncbi:hypothetical protein M4I21_12825 [Cellulophaga sp. 20_2_10]|uniref:hypothetical protein n=1 Tax=Cellulophaga sp. 20_2_10 TaxID=2942476 RepID=UPI00201AF5EB|nr:hypothetical protein [Cellulophaga sp. 20_2_10]MCL5246701.1 hypothetical protein [Cellulophaga sp. 20_2_10]